ncbi:MAG: sulfur carrier protein ThiS [Nevskia sp.]|nr:sulfur carrier protein ThiS [Nevskia sp.]
MQIVLNGEPVAVADGSSVADLVGVLGLQGQRVAVELNGDIVSRSRWTEMRLKDGDHAEIVRAIGGG